VGSWSPRSNTGAYVTAYLAAIDRVLAQIFDMKRSVVTGE
jgi:hypothetical protein